MTNTLTIEGTAREARKAFDYAALDDKTAKQVLASAHFINRNTKRIGQTIMEIGAALSDVKQLIEHGQFVQWLESEVGMNVRTAQRYMQTAVLKDKSDTVSYLAPTTLYAITANSTPEPIRETIVGRIANGERLEDDAVRDLIADARREQQQQAAQAKLTPTQRKAKKAAEARRQREHEKERAKIDAEREARQAARQEAARLVVDCVGDRLPELLLLLQGARETSFAEQLENPDKVVGW